jgi:hypothetical protein
MDSLLIGTVVGGILTLAGNLLANYLNIRKEREQWKRSQESEDRKWSRDEQHRLRQELYDIYRDCLQYLSLILGECRTNPGKQVSTGEIYFDEHGEHEKITYVRESISEKERLYREEAQKCLWLLLLRQRGLEHPSVVQFEYDLNWFDQSLSSHLPERLREYVLELAKSDGRLHSLVESSERQTQPNHSLNPTPR